MDAPTTPRARRARRITAPGIIRIRPEVSSAEFLAAYGWDNITAMARALRVEHTTLRRALSGETAPGERLIAAMLEVTGKPFAKLFTVHPAPPTQE